MARLPDSLIFLRVSGACVAQAALRKTTARSRGISDRLMHDSLSRALGQFASPDPLSPRLAAEPLSCQGARASSGSQLAPVPEAKFSANPRACPSFGCGGRRYRITLRFP